MNTPKHGTPVSQLKLDEGPLTIVPRTIRLRDEPPLAVKRADDRPDDGPAHYTTFCDRRGRVLSTDRPDGVPTEADRALDAMIFGDRAPANLDAEGLDAIDHSETPGGTFEDTDASLDDGGCRSRRASRQRGYERLQDELELVAEIREQARAEHELARQAEALQWREKAVRRLAGACTCVFVLGLAIGALAAAVVAN
jgi:hypothetical protein